MSGYLFGVFMMMVMVGVQFVVDDLFVECEQGEIDGNYDEMCEIFSEDSIELFWDGFYDVCIKVVVFYMFGIYYVFCDEGMVVVIMFMLLMIVGCDCVLLNVDNGILMFVVM